MPSSSSSSSAAPIQYDQFGRQGIGVVQPQSGADYPLVGVPSDDIRYLLADAFLAYDDPADYSPELVPYQPPFRIVWLYGLGTIANSQQPGFPSPVNDVDLVVVDDNNCVVFDSTQATHVYSRKWTDRLAIYGWETDEATMFIVVHTKWGETADFNMEPTEYQVHIMPDHAVLDERAVERRPKRVKSLTVVLDNFTRTAVEFVEGFNMDIAHEGEFLRGDGRRVTQRLLFDASPGNGLGIFPGCEPASLVIKQINNVPPTAAGDFYLAATDCYYARQPTTLISSSPRISSPTPAMIQVGNDCSPCCGCEEYVATAKYMNRTRNRYKTVGTQLESIRDQYHINRDRWNESKCCFEQFPLRVITQAQICPTIDVGVQFCNLSAECVGPLEMNIEVEIIESGGGSIGGAEPCNPADKVSEEIPGFTFMRGVTNNQSRRTGAVERAQLGGGHPNYIAYWESVEPAQSVWVRFRLGFGCCGTDSAGFPFLIKVTATASAGIPIGGDVGPLLVPVCGSAGSSLSAALASATSEVLLRCPKEDSDTFNPLCLDETQACD